MLIPPDSDNTSQVRRRVNSIVVIPATVEALRIYRWIYMLKCCSHSSEMLSPWNKFQRNKHICIGWGFFVLFCFLLQITFYIKQALFTLVFLSERERGHKKGNSCIQKSNCLAEEQWDCRKQDRSISSSSSYANIFSIPVVFSRCLHHLH